MFALCDQLLAATPLVFALSSVGLFYIVYLQYIRFLEGFDAPALQQTKAGLSEPA